MRRPLKRLRNIKDEMYAILQKNKGNENVKKDRVTHRRKSSTAVWIKLHPQYKRHAEEEASKHISIKDLSS